MGTNQPIIAGIDHKTVGSRNKHNNKLQKQMSETNLNNMNYSEKLDSPIFEKYENREFGIIPFTGFGSQMSNLSTK
jgi:hypothetical protein